MSTDEIEYKGKKYSIRNLYIDKQVGWVNIAQLGLDKALRTPAGHYRKGAESIDDQIYWYADENDWKLEDSELLKAIKNGE